MVVTSTVSGSATAEADALPVVLTAVIWAVLLAAAGAPVVVAMSVAGDVDEPLGDSVVVCSFAVAVVAVGDVVAVELLDVRRGCASEGCDDPAPEGVDDATAAVFDDVVDDVSLVRSAAADDEATVPAVDFGPRALWPVDFFADVVFDVAELDESDAELWSVSSALATATTGPARDNPSASAAIPALAPR